MTVAIEAQGLGRRYGRHWALSECTLAIPSGHVVGLVGRNGAGKSTLLQLAAGLLAPSAGVIEVLGRTPAGSQAQLQQVGFVAQDTPVYSTLSVKDHLDMGARLNPCWDPARADARIDRLEIDRRQRAGKLSGGLRAQLALTLAIAKRPELLILDEPVASLDPLARREFLQGLMEIVADEGITIVLSSHLIADLERVCDYLVVLAGSRVQVAGPIECLLACHRRLTGPRRDSRTLPSSHEVITQSHTERQTTLVVRTEEPTFDPVWTIEQLSLEDLALAYMTRAQLGMTPDRPTTAVGR